MDVGYIQDCKQHRKHLPGKILSPYVNCYQIISGTFERTKLIDLYPDGGVGVIINLGGAITLNDKIFGKGVYFDGANSRNVLLRVSGDVNLIRVRFNPGMFCLFFNADLENYHNAFNNLYSINCILPKNFFRFLELCSFDEQKVTSIEAWLTYNLSDPDGNMSLVLSTLEYISSSHYDVRLQALAEEMGIEIRKLQRLFKKRVGMSPKKLIKLLRADFARKMLDTCGSLSCLDITYRCGYYDQAHFNREFKDIYEITPNEYRKRLFSEKSECIA
ncbi:helix-turn-helix domain-containing protein [Microbulbifer rhizosphaerae]|uniref:AraC-like DNA-binding protein n=1 Tax=Microbulbifer rhizosphaerae TaxID=1562603 RepID=A0A7W4W9S0_9GAMM|nr:helix-turn-helix domain-containing protein [Microbulbifer rhizosphaerae]MBB3060285.1 AraC-like DNA-binding protein [Microbulbifer rhizosphaerae]